MKWVQYFLNIARATAEGSKDPNTKVGAVIVNPDGRIISQGYNGMAQGAPEYWDDDVKDEHVIHAEVNAIANAARAGVSTLGATMYLTLPPCQQCAKVIAASGIQRVYFSRENWLDYITRKPEWRARFHRTREYLELAGVKSHGA